MAAFLFTPVTIRHFERKSLRQRYVGVRPNPALNQTGRHVPSRYRASARPAG